MKKSILIGSLSIIGISFIPRMPGLPIGSSLPGQNISMKDISGKMISLIDAKKANGLMVMFSCNSCPVVHANQSRTGEICSYALKNEVGVTLINSNEAERSGNESLESMQQYAKAQFYNWYYLVDKSNVLADAFSASRTPEVFLFDKDNKLVYHGAIDDSPGDISKVKHTYLKDAINDLTQGKPIQVKESRSVGCSIHRG